MSVGMSMPLLLRKAIYNALGEVESFGSIKPLFEAAGLNKSLVATRFTNQDTYSLHKVTRMSLKRNEVVVAGMDAQRRADLVNTQQFSKHNAALSTP